MRLSQSECPVIDGRVQGLSRTILKKLEPDFFIGRCQRLALLNSEIGLVHEMHEKKEEAWNMTDHQAPLARLDRMRASYLLEMRVWCDVDEGC